MQILYTHIHTQASTYQTQNTVRIIFEIHKNRDGVEVEKEKGVGKNCGWSSRDDGTSVENVAGSVYK